MNNDKRCSYVNPETGEECRAWAMRDGSGMCFWHGGGDRVKEAGAKGALASHARPEPVEIEHVSLETMDDVLAIHERAIAVLLHQLELDPSDTKTASNLSLALHRYAQAKDMTIYERKLKELEARLNERNKA